MLFGSILLSVEAYSNYFGLVLDYFMFIRLPFTDFGFFIRQPSSKLAVFYSTSRSDLRFILDSLHLFAITSIDSLSFV